MKFGRVVAATAAASMIMAGAAAVQPAEAASTKLQITKVYVNSPGSDSSSNKSVNGEYVKIKNNGKKSVSLKGYTLRDESNHVYKFASFTLSRGKTITVYSGKGSDSSGKRYMGRGWHVWNNSGGDSAILRNASGKKIDSCTWKGPMKSSVKC